MRRMIFLTMMGLVLLLTSLTLLNCGDKQIASTAPQPGPTEPPCTRIIRTRFEGTETFPEKSLDLTPGASTTAYSNISLTCDSTVIRVQVTRYLVKEDGQRLKVRLIHNQTSQEFSVTLPDIPDYEGWTQDEVRFGEHMKLPHGSYRLVLTFTLSSVGTSTEGRNPPTTNWDQNGSVQAFGDCYTYQEDCI